MIYFLLAATAANAFRINFGQFLTEPRCPSVDFYLTIEGTTQPTTAVKVASNKGYNSWEDVDVTSTLNAMTAETHGAGTTYEADSNFTIAFKCASPITQLTNEEDADFAKWPTGEFMGRNFISQGFGSSTSATLWLSKGDYGQDVYFYNMLFTETFVGAGDCAEGQDKTECFVVNAMSLGTQNPNNADINFDTRGDQNEDLDPSQAATRLCQVGKEAININNDGANYVIRPSITCGGTHMWYFIGDRQNREAYPIRLMGDSAGSKAYASGLVLLATVLFTTLFV